MGMPNCSFNSVHEGAQSFVVLYSTYSMPLLLRDWHTLDYRLVLLVFVAYMLIDGMNAYYTLAVTERKPSQAATVGALMYFLIAFGILSYVQNMLYILPLALGSWIGTFLTVRYERNAEARRIARKC